jgi:NADPH:quinone reductase-like Zn-dependent oxidoreductase
LETTLQAYELLQSQRAKGKLVIKMPKTMKAVMNSGYGDLKSTLRVGECPMPELDPASSMILVKVHAAALNPVDYKVILGHMKPFMGELTNFPRVPGCDCSGIVVEAGAACTWAKAGDRIFADWSGNLAGKGSGTLAEYVLMPESFAGIAPKNLSFEQCAAVPLAGLTSYQALKHQGQMQEGSKVLVLGGSGGTGTYALACAKALGAGHVATTSSSVDLCKSVGADQVVNYKDGEDFAVVLKDGEYDVVFDCVGGLEGWEKSKKVMKAGARYVTIAGPQVPPDQHDGFVWKAFLTDTGTERAAADLAVLRDMCEKGQMTPVIDPSSPYTLETTLQAYELLQSQRAKGKLVIKIC